MVDTARTTAALQTLFADNTAGAISAQDLRDFLVSAKPGIDVFAGRVYTLSETPHLNFPGTGVINGVAGVRLLTSPVSQWMSGAAFQFNLNVTTGFRFADIAATLVTLTIDFGAGVKAELVAADVIGVVDTANGVYHPSAVKIESSDDNVAYTPFGTSLTGLNDDPAIAAQWACLFNDDPQAGRYWRWTFNEPSPGAGDNWLMLSRVHGYGRLVT